MVALRKVTSEFTIDAKKIEPTSLASEAPFSSQNGSFLFFNDDAVSFSDAVFPGQKLAFEKLLLILDERVR
jgi:hypothetical protein